MTKRELEDALSLLDVLLGTVADLVGTAQVLATAMGLALPTTLGDLRKISAFVDRILVPVALPTNFSPARFQSGLEIEIARGQAAIVTGWGLTDIILGLVDTRMQRTLHDRICGTRVIWEQ
ncbi:MAG: hypothetical protein ACP5VQ_11115 [Phycisphaerae bacterium]